MAHVVFLGFTLGIRVQEFLNQAIIVSNPGTVALGTMSIFATKIDYLTRSFGPRILTLFEQKNGHSLFYDD